MSFLIKIPSVRQTAHCSKEVRMLFWGISRMRISLRNLHVIGHEWQVCVH